MKTTLAVLVMMVACSYVSSEVANYYCGRRLSEVLASLCWSGETTVMKRDAEMWPAVKPDARTKWWSADKLDAGWWPEMEPMAMGARTLTGSRFKRGPVDECCDKPCTVSELMTYC